MKLITALENLSEGIAICSPLRDNENNIIDFVYDYLNDAMASMAKLKKDLMTGRRMSEVIVDFTGSELFERCCSVIETGVPAKRNSVAINQTIIDHKIEG